MKYEMISFKGSFVGYHEIATICHIFIVDTFRII